MSCELTKRPSWIPRITHRDRVLGIRLRHLCIQAALDICRAVVAFEITSLVANATCHADRLRPANLEPVSLRVFARVQQLQFLVLEHGTERRVLSLGRNFVGAGRAADLPVQNCKRFLRVGVVIGRWRAVPRGVVGGTARLHSVEEGYEGVRAEGEAGWDGGSCDGV